jgi:cell division septum initiation protein DivIVA
MAEVDEFLDEVEAELARMQRENDELRDKLSAVTRGGGVAGSAEPIPAVRQAEAPMAPPSAVPAGAPPSAPPTEAAAKVLALAQKTADELVADAKAEADRLMSEARERAEKIDAEIKAKSSKVEQEARQRADSIEHEVQQRREQVFGKLESERSQLEHELETLRHFEREYRSRLKSYLEDQLRKLETGDGVNESEHLVRRDADEAERSDEPSGGGNNSTQTGGSLRSVASLLEDDQR